MKISGFPIEDFGNGRTDNKGAEPPIIPERQKLKIKGKDLKKTKSCKNRPHVFIVIWCCKAA